MATEYEQQGEKILKDGQLMTTKQIIEDLAVGALAVVMLEQCSIEREELRAQLNWITGQK